MNIFAILEMTKEERRLTICVSKWILHLERQKVRKEFVLPCVKNFWQDIE